MLRAGDHDKSIVSYYAIISLNILSPSRIPETEDLGWKSFPQ